MKYFQLPRNILTSENISIKCKSLGCVTLRVIRAGTISSSKVRKFHSTTLCHPFRERERQETQIFIEWENLIPLSDHRYRFSWKYFHMGKNWNKVSSILPMSSCLTLIIFWHFKSENFIHNIFTICVQFYQWQLWTGIWWYFSVLKFQLMFSLCFSPPELMIFTHASPVNELTSPKAYEDRKDVFLFLPMH